MPFNAGDIHWAELDGFRGTEQGGRRPVLILSENFYNQRSKRVIACPISSRSRGWKTEVPLPAMLPVAGIILTDQIRTLDRASRLFDFICVLPAPQMATVRGIIGLLLGILPAAPS